jgi:hypothetical protein
MLLTKLRKRGIDGNARQPSRKPCPFIEILDMGQGIQKTILHRVFRVFAMSHHPIDDTENAFSMAFAKFSKGNSSSGLSGRYQLLLAPSSKIANL